MKRRHYKSKNGAAKTAIDIGCSYVVVVDDATFTCHRNEFAAWEQAKRDTGRICQARVYRVVVESEDLEGIGRPYSGGLSGRF